MAMGSVHQVLGMPYISLNPDRNQDVDLKINLHSAVSIR